MKKILNLIAASLAGGGAMAEKSKFLSVAMRTTGTLTVVALALLASGCATALGQSSLDVKAQANPASDPSNSSGWILNKEMSDEFEGRGLDTSKWLIQGTDGEYRSKFIGRAPSQFSTKNVRLEDGKLKLQTRWEPAFSFSAKPDNEGKKYENITTAAVISKRQFLYGYMEIKCKAADASITSSFWMTGHNSELDVFEFMGAPAQAHKKHLEKEYLFTMIDWGNPKAGMKRVWQASHSLDWRVADAFHVYGCEWNENYLKFYADGKLVGSVTKEDLGERWVLKTPLWIWVDSETFPWHGLPQKKDLPVDYEIDYIRVWQST
jgi:beta-glucanase (GH16 family)